jgi:hypothetical protein
MSTEANTVTTPAIDDTAIRAESARILSHLATKHNRSVDSFEPEIVDRAVEQARANLERSAADASNSYKLLYEREREQRELAESTLASIRTQGIKHGGGGTGGAPVSAAQAKARAGEHAWNHRLTDAQKIAALGVPPESVNVNEARKVFGRGADPKLGSDLHKSDPVKYRTLKQVALAVGSYGN